MKSEYSPPLALTVLSGIFLILGAICFLVIVGDILLRRGWRSMMWIMIPVYPINAAYMLPVTLYVYFKYGRPTNPDSKATEAPHIAGAASQCRSDPQGDLNPTNRRNESDASSAEKGTKGTSGIPPPEPRDSHHCHEDTSRPMLATVLVGVSHCGAGCVLGDLVGEWLVYGTGVTINGESIWAELLIDYAFALLFGIAFQYFSIAPMSGEYGLKTVWRAAKADILSLTSFEVGAFGWMVIYQVGIFGYRLSITTWTYWWMMQIGMALGFATAMPVNWFLISKGIKEPCA